MTGEWRRRDDGESEAIFNGKTRLSKKKDREDA